MMIFVLKTRSFALQTRNFVFKNDEFCSYLLHDPNPKMLWHTGWDSCAEGGGSETAVESASSQQGKSFTDLSSAGNICIGVGIKPTTTATCCSFISQAALDRESDLEVSIPNTSSWAEEGILTSTVMPWRDQTRVDRYFGPPANSGADPYGWVWELA